MEANLDGATDPVEQISNILKGQSNEGQQQDRDSVQEDSGQEDSRSVEEHSAREDDREERLTQDDGATREVEELQGEALESEEVSEDSETSEETDENTEETDIFRTLEELAEATGQDKFFEDVKTTVKVDGQEMEVNLAELRSGYQRDVDYRQKTMQLAEEKRQFEELKEQASQKLSTRLQDSEIYLNSLAEQLDGEYQNVNWHELKATDPGLYAATKQDFLERQQQFEQTKNKVLNDKQRLEQEHYEHAMQDRQAFLQEQSKLLTSAIPEWTDQEVAKNEMEAISSYAVSQGYTEQEVSEVIDHRNVIMLRKAKLYDDLMKSKGEVNLKRIKKLPKVVKKTSASPNKAQQSKQKSQDKMTRLRKSGSLNDAASVLKDLIN